MSLVFGPLQTNLESLFGSSPGSTSEAAQAWADAVEGYFTDVVPMSTTVATAAATLKTALQAAFGAVGPDPSTAAASMEAAFLAFATTVGSGMTGFIATPPPAPVGFASLLGSNQSTQSDAAQAWASAIDTWAKTGLAQVVGGPPPPPVNWT